jgi:ABC-2 type transport system permease protein
MLNIGIVNHDGRTVITEDMIQFIGKLDHVQISEIDEAETKDLIASGKLDAAVTIPDGFAQSVKKGQPETMQIVSIKGVQVTAYVKSYLNQYVESLASIGKAVKGNEAAFDNLYANVRNARFHFSTETVEDRSVHHKMTNQTIGYLIVFMLFSAVNLSGIIIKEKENRTYFRLITTPITARTYVLSNIIVNLLMMIQIAVTLLVMIRLFHIDPGIPFHQMFFILLIFALVAISFSLVIIAFANNSMTASGLQTMLIIPTCLLAGCFFPIEIMPAVIRQIAGFLPQHWLLDTFSKLQLGHSLQSLYLNLAILIAFAVTFALIAIYKFGRNDDTRSYI